MTSTRIECYDNSDLERIFKIPQRHVALLAQRRTGSGVSFKVGRKRLYRKSVVHAWLDSLEKASA